jgi:hypothetical protein
MDIRLIFISIIVFLLKPAMLSGQINDTILEEYVQTQAPTDSIIPKRLAPVIIGGTLLIAGSMSVLYKIRYKNYLQNHFHLSNDDNVFLLLGKMGHITAAYNISGLSYSALVWSGLNENKSILYGGGIGMLYLSAIEFLDGFSPKLGFSPGDLVANTLGTGLFVGQQLLWKEQRMSLKWSFQQTISPIFRPDLLTKTLAHQWVKDYNGQTYWLSVNIKSFIKPVNNFPGWLNFSMGYGAQGYTGDSQLVNGKTTSSFNRHRQLFLSGDIDLSRIKTNSKTLHMILNTLTIIDFPFPALEFRQGKIITHAILF